VVPNASPRAGCESLFRLRGAVFKSRDLMAKIVYLALGIAQARCEAPLGIARLVKA